MILSGTPDTERLIDGLYESIDSLESGRTRIHMTISTEPFKPILNIRYLTPTSL